jgi:hypothetical protein
MSFSEPPGERPAADVDDAPRAPEPEGGHGTAKGMLPDRERRRTAVERGFMRLVATAGIVGIAVLLGAVLVGQDVDGWIVGLAVGLTSVILSALLWSSRQL